MMAFASMLVDAAEKAGMKVPPNPDGNFSPEDYPHFQVYCTVQLGRAMQWGEHWDNAKIIAAVPEDQIRKITLEQLMDLGLQTSTEFVWLP